MRLPGRFAELRAHLPTLPQALASLMQTVVVALFVLTFVAQPLLIPSESMERTLLVGDFLLFNKQTYATPGPIGRWVLPYRTPARGDIVVFRHPYPPMLIKRVVGVPGDRLRIAGGQVFINGVALREPYAAFEPAPPDQGRDNFPGEILSRSPDRSRVVASDAEPDARRRVDRARGRVLRPRRQSQSQPGLALLGICAARCLRRPPADHLFLARPPLAQRCRARFRRKPREPPADDRLGHERELAAKIEGFARWRRIFHVVH